MVSARRGNHTDTDSFLIGPYSCSGLEAMSPSVLWNRLNPGLVSGGRIICGVFPNHHTIHWAHQWSIWCSRIMHDGFSQISCFTCVALDLTWDFKEWEEHDAQHDCLIVYGKEPRDFHDPNECSRVLETAFKRARQSQSGMLFHVRAGGNTPSAHLRTLNVEPQ